MYYSYSVEELKAMIEHWVNTVPNGYLGYGYGFNIHSMLLKPLSVDSADYILQEMKRQIPPLQNAQLDIYRSRDEENEREYYSIVLNGRVKIALGSVGHVISE